MHVGDWFCTPVRAIMTRKADFPDALEFNGFRFADPEFVCSISANEVLQKVHSKLTDVDMAYHI
jgi:hypothetical protein